jgi:hypothetical protein
MHENRARNTIGFLARFRTLPCTPLSPFRSTQLVSGPFRKAEEPGYPERSSVWIRIRRRSRERRSPVSEIVTDTPTICQRDTGQRGRSAMDTPRHEGTPYLIEVTSRPGKYELPIQEGSIEINNSRNKYGARRKSGYSRGEI